MSQINLEDFFTYYRGTATQKKAISQLAEAMPQSLLRDLSPWVQTYRERPTLEANNPLPVPYQSQRDNASGTGYRECFSSSCAMVAMFYGKIANDDAYNEIRSQFGDSTDAQAQVRALRSIGLQADFCMDGNVERLEGLIAEGKPVPVGWLHKGAVPGTGGGHYAVICGFTDDDWIVNDPYGDCDLINGGYPGSTNGEMLRYSRKNWTPRWECDGPGTGWYVHIWE